MIGISFSYQVPWTSRAKQVPSSSGSRLSLFSAAKRALFDNLGKDEHLALEIDKIVRATKKDGFRGNRFKEREIELAIHSILSITDYDAKQILELVKNQSEY